MRLSWYHNETLGEATRLPADTELVGWPQRLRTIFESRDCNTLCDVARVNACEFILWDGVGYKALEQSRNLLEAAKGEAGND